MTTTSDFDALRATLLQAIRADQPMHQKRLEWNRAEILSHQRSALRDLLEHAMEHSPFHAQRLAGIDPASVDPDDMAALPVMTKAQMMSSFDDLVTDRRLTRTLVEHALTRTANEPVPILGSYIAYASGGSSGVRAVFVYDHVASRQLVGSYTRGLVRRLQALGDTLPPGGIPIAYVAAGNAVHQTGSTEALTAGGTLGFHYVNVPATQPLTEVVARLNDIRPPILAGYPSMLARLAVEQEEGRLHISPMAVTASSEPLSSEAAELIGRAFGAPLVNTFGATEGLMGSSLPDDEVIVFAEDGCIVELVDEQNRPVPPGTPSAKVLVTSLANRLQPLIRYELTDQFVRLPEVSDHGYLRATVEGRADDAFRYGTVTVHPFVIRSVFVTTPGVTEYQVRQTGDGLDIVLVADRPVDTDGVTERLRAALDRAGVVKPHVNVTEVAELALSSAGKLRRFVPLT
ncbi:MAG: AMP-binding protein [Mycobacterium sp.]